MRKITLLVLVSVFVSVLAYADTAHFISKPIHGPRHIQGIWPEPGRIYVYRLYDGVVDGAHIEWTRTDYLYYKDNAKKSVYQQIENINDNGGGKIVIDLKRLHW